MAAQILPAPMQLMQPMVDWRAAPVAPGNWLWRSLAGGSEAVFQSAAGVQLTLRCNLASRTVTVVRSGAVPGSVLSVRTSNLERSLPPSGTLGARDPLLDAISFSRGRFAVEGGGAVRLIVPAWPEAARTIGDCRK
ncbi:MAG TPA: hypothetical protein VM913_06160 [Sphingomicrobium sp.]|nr:hypothetical protein [Sphingomicrobium sp.]